MAKCDLCGQKVDVKGHSYQHHKKAFELFRIAYENWESPPDYPRMTKEQFRKNVIIKSGHYIAHYDLDGGLVFEAKSLKYSKANQNQFNEIYRDCVRYIEDQLLRCGKGDLAEMVMREF